jgi:very-short-patch-repair endonuclease
MSTMYLLTWYKVNTQVGASGYKIDLGIIHKDHPDSYLCGIECDGKTYHSSKVARDRDRLRQQVLENLGWKIYRIWSQEWFKKRKFEVTRLKDFLQKLENSSS